MSAASVADKHIFNENIHHYYSVGFGDADRSRAISRNAYQSCSLRWELGDAMKSKNKNILMRRTPTSTGWDASHTKLWRLWLSSAGLVVESDFVLAIDGHAACWTPQRDRDKNELNAECQMIWQKPKSFLNPHSLLWWTVWLILITIVSLIPPKLRCEKLEHYIDRRKMIFTKSVLTAPIARTYF